MRRLPLLALAAAAAALVAGCEVLEQTGLDQLACAVVPSDGTVLGGECGGLTCSACETCAEDPLSGAAPVCKEVCLSDTDCETGCCGFLIGTLATVCLDATECEVECGGVPCTAGQGCADDAEGTPVCAQKCADDSSCPTGYCCLESSTGDRTCHEPAACG